PPDDVIWEMAIDELWRQLLETIPPTGPDPSVRPAKPYKRPIDAVIDAMDVGIKGVQLILDITGTVDPTPISSGSNAIISMPSGDWGEAGGYLLGAIPLFGNAKAAEKLGEKGCKAAKIIHEAETNGHHTARKPN